MCPPSSRFPPCTSGAVIPPTAGRDHTESLLSGQQSNRFNFNEDQANKHRQAYAAIDHLFQQCKKIGFAKIAFGTDIFTDPEMLRRMNDEFVLRTKWFTPGEILRQATSTNAQLLALSGPRNPYPGKLGVIEEGSYADLLLIDGDPLKDISILTKPGENLALIMKDGKIYKNILNINGEKNDKHTVGSNPV